MASPLLRRCVQIDGLKSRPELNGSFGSALNFDALANRYQVIVGVKRSFAIKADNLHDVASVRYRALEERAQKRVDTVRAMLEAGEEAPLEDVAEGSSALQVLTLLSAGWACADSLLANQAVSRLTAMGPAGPESAALQPLVACDTASHAGLCGLVDAMIVQKVGRLPFRAMYDLLCDIACGYQLSNIAGKSGLAGVDMFDCTSMQGMDTLMQKCAGDPKKMLEMLQTSMEVSKSAAAWSTSAAGLACKRMLGAVGAVDLAVRYVSEYAALLDGGLLDATRAEHGEEAANSVEFFMRLPAYASCNLLKLLLVSTPEDGAKHEEAARAAAAAAGVLEALIELIAVLGRPEAEDAAAGARRRDARCTRTVSADALAGAGTAALAQQTVHLLVKERLAAEARKEAGEEEEAVAAEKMTPMMLQECFMALARLALGDTPAAADRRARIRALHGIPLVVDAIAAHYTPETFKWGLDCCLHVAHGEDEYKMQWERCLAQHPDLQERAMRDAMRARGAEGTAAGTPLPAQLAELLSGFVK